MQRSVPRHVKYRYGGKMRVPSRYQIVLEFIQREVKMGGCFPHVSRISTYIGCSDNGVRETLNRLTIKGYLTKERLPRKGHRPQYRYELIETNIQRAA